MASPGEIEPRTLRFPPDRPPIPSLTVAPVSDPVPIPTRHRPSWMDPRSLRAQTAAVFFLIATSAGSALLVEGIVSQASDLPSDAQPVKTRDATAFRELIAFARAFLAAGPVTDHEMGLEVDQAFNVWRSGRGPVDDFIRVKIRDNTTPWVQGVVATPSPFVRCSHARSCWVSETYKERVLAIDRRWGADRGCGHSGWRVEDSEHSLVQPSWRDDALSTQRSIRAISVDN